MQIPSILMCFTYKIISAESFQWIDGSINNFQKFAQGEPNGLDKEGDECVEIYPTGGFSGMWNDHDCSVARHFACKMPKCNCKLY